MLGTYQIINNGVNITTGISSSSPVSVKLKLDACAEIVETRVEDGRVRGRISAVGYGGVSKEARGWIDLFEPTCRWAKVSFNWKMFSLSFYSSIPNIILSAFNVF